MSDEREKIDISPLSHEFTSDGLTVDVEIYKIDGNEGWTLEVAVDDDTSIVWTTSFPTDERAWDEFEHAVNSVGLRALLDADGEVATIH